MNTLASDIQRPVTVTAPSPLGRIRSIVRAICRATGTTVGFGTLRRVVAPLLLIAIVAAPMVFSLAATADTRWHGWTILENTLDFDRMDVNFDLAVGKRLNNHKVEKSTHPGATVVKGPNPKGYQLTFAGNVPVGMVVVVQFNTTDPKLRRDGTALFLGGVQVGTIDLTGVIRDQNDVVKGRAADGLIVKPNAAQSAILKEIEKWGIAVSSPPQGGGGAVAHWTALANRYTNDATLLPTIGEYAVYTNRRDPVAAVPTIENYFRFKFLPKSPKMLVLNPALVDVAILVPDSIASANGLYSFEITDAGVVSRVDARFTFVFQRMQPKWMIRQHHSSANPAVAGAGNEDACLGDLDGDGWVDGADLGIFLALWGGDPDIADLDGDGVADANDLGILLANWGECPF